MDEVFFQKRESTHTIMPDLPDFVSPIDGKVVHGRRGLREHDKRHKTTNIADFNKPGGVWDRRQQQRENLFTAKGPSQVDTIRRAFDDLRSGRVRRK